MMAFMDFEKVFNSVEGIYRQNVLQRMNFGPMLTTKVQINFIQKYFEQRNTQRAHKS